MLKNSSPGTPMKVERSRREDADYQHRQQPPLQPGEQTRSDVREQAPYPVPALGREEPRQPPFARLGTSAGLYPPDSKAPSP